MLSTGARTQWAQARLAGPACTQCARPGQAVVSVRAPKSLKWVFWEHPTPKFPSNRKDFGSNLSPRTNFPYLTEGEVLQNCD